jgi:hypothetical protein
VQIALLRNLNLQLAASELQIHKLLNTRSLGGWCHSLVLGDDIATSDAEIDSALTNECGNVGSREEDKRERKVLDQGNVEAVVAVELDVGAGEELNAGLIEAALLGDGEEQTVVQAADEVSQGGQCATEAARHAAVFVQAGSLSHGGRCGGGGGGIVG